jgi:hypothetical protein
MRLFPGDEHSVDYDIHVNILAQNQHTFWVPISTENCGRETPIKTAGKNGHQSKLNNI